MFTVAEIKAFLLTKGKTVKTIKPIQTGDDEGIFTVFNPKVLFFGHIQGQVEDSNEVGYVSITMDGTIEFNTSGKQANAESPDLQILDCFFAKANVVNATALFVGYKIDLV